MPTVYTLHTDGGARGNPGPAGVGAVLRDGAGEVVADLSKPAGWATNNEAEYLALIEGMQMALHHGVRELLVKMDSLLVVQQMKGTYRVKSAGLKPLHSEARTLAKKFERVTFEAVPREQNSEADALVNQAIDGLLIDDPTIGPTTGQTGFF